jgi:hypothetical protein
MALCALDAPALACRRAPQPAQLQLRRRGAVQRARCVRAVAQSPHGRAGLRSAAPAAGSSLRCAPALRSPNRAPLAWNSQGCALRCVSRKKHPVFCAF